MNKLLTKIAKALLGLSMAVGVGVALSFSKKDSVIANAAQGTVSYSSGSYSNSSITWKDSATDTYLTVLQEQNGAQTAPNSSYVSNPRWYSGNKITFTTGNGATITEMTFTATTNGYATTLANSTWSDESEPSADGTTVTWSGSVNSSLNVVMGGQCRLSTSITFKYSVGGNSYTCSYDPNVGSSGDTVTNMPSNTQIGDGETWTLDTSKKPVRSGYLFVGWASTSESTTPISSIENVKAAKTVYAIWTLDTRVTVTFVGGTDKGTRTGSGGSDTVTKSGITLYCSNAAFATAQYRFYASSSITISSTVGKIKYIEFTGGDSTYPITNISGTGYSKGIWEGNADSVSLSTSSQARSENVIIKCEPLATYTVSFDVGQDGYGTVSPSSITNIPEGSSISVVNNQITINGSTVTANPAAATAQYSYTFSSWDNTSGSVTSNRTITANFNRSENSYGVSGAIQHGSLSTTPSIVYNNSLNINIVPDAHYSYPESLTEVRMGGVVLAEGTDYSYNNENGLFSIEHVTGEVTINASCNQVEFPFTVTYDANGGTVSPSSEEIYSGGNPLLPIPTKNGYQFNGWLIEGDDTVYTSSNQYTVNGNVTFVASWVAVYTISFNSNGGSNSPSDINLESGGKFEFPSPGTKANHTFNGWTTAGDETYYKTGDESLPVTASATYIASWTEAAKVTVTYVAGSHGTGSYSHTNQYVGSYNLLAFVSLTGVSASSGFRFKDYTVDSSHKNPDAEIELTEAITIIVNFESIPVSDYIDLSVTGVNKTAYADGNFSGKTAKSPHSDALYAGQVIKHTATGAIQFRKTNPGGIVSTTSGGKVRAVSVTWATSPMGEVERALDIYCSNNAYTSGADLYDVNKQGTFVGDISYTNSTTYETSIKITGDYDYIGLIPNNGTLYIMDITIEWGQPNALSSVSVSFNNDPADRTFNAGSNFAFNGALTAFYTINDDTVVTPTGFFLEGEEGVGEEITNQTILTVADHDGGEVYVQYKEGGVTKYDTFTLIVNAAPATSVTLTSYSASVSVQEVFDVSSITATVNPANYAEQGVTWEVYNAGGLVEDETYIFEDNEFVGYADADVVFHVKANSNSSIYAEFTLSITSNAIVHLFDEDANDVTNGSMSVFADVGTIDFGVSTENFSGTISYTWGTSDSSVISIFEEIDEMCSFTVNGVTDTVTLSCLVEDTNNNSVLVSVDVTVVAVEVASVNWTAPTINVYSGAELTSTSGWNVKYRTNSDPNNDKTPDSFKILLGGSEISLPYTWNVNDDGKTLCVKVGDVSSSTTTVNVTQSLREIRGNTTTSWSYTFTSKIWSDTGSNTINGKEWSMSGTYTKDKYFNYAEKGMQFGSAGNPWETISLQSSDFSGNIESITVYTSGASGVDATVKASVGGTDFGKAKALTSSNTAYTFMNKEGKSGTISIDIVNNSAKAIYVKQIVVNTISSSATLSNVVGHEAAQKAVVKFAKSFNTALSQTEYCTSNLDTAWAAATNAWDTFLLEVAALGETEEAYALNLIRYANAQWTTGTDDNFEYCLERALATYEKCVNDHDQEDFMSDVRTVGSRPNVKPFLVLSQNTGSVAIIVIISMVSVSAIGGYFFLRKRKEQ